MEVLKMREKVFMKQMNATTYFKRQNSSNGQYLTEHSIILDQSENRQIVDVFVRCNLKWKDNIFQVHCLLLYNESINELLFHCHYTWFDVHLHVHSMNLLPLLVLMSGKSWIIQFLHYVGWFQSVLIFHVCRFFFTQIYRLQTLHLF